MSYAEITFKDKNPIKRWLQKQRLVSAIKFYNHSTMLPEKLCDFGAGNGELCKMLSKNYPEARIICYEPTPSLLSEARENLGSIAKINFYQDIRGITCGTLDVIFCLEVFEHLPPDETIDAFQSISDLLKPGGIVVIGVPVEIGIPALYKGIFRMFRRYGAFDANIKNVALSFLRRPPANRPTIEIKPGLNYHYEHIGFDYRPFKKIISNYFKVTKVSTSPFAGLGLLLAPEVYFVAEKANES